jgi:S1-C subfamily serine protease
MKNIIIITIIFILYACHPNTPFEMGSMTPVPVEGSYISLQDDSGLLLRIGSAVIIEEGYAITNRHVIEGSDRMKGYMSGGIEFPVTEVILSDRIDLALFKIPCGVGEPIKMGERVRTGEKVYSAGTSNGSTVYEGIVRETDLVIHHVDVDLPNPLGRDTNGRPLTYGFVCEGELNKGFSGGPIVNSRSELVGIIQGYITEIYSQSRWSELKTINNYGTGYHIMDILGEIERMKGLNPADRCK